MCDCLRQTPEARIYVWQDPEISPVTAPAEAIKNCEIISKHAPMEQLGIVAECGCNYFDDDCDADDYDDDDAHVTRGMQITC